MTPCVETSRDAFLGGALMLHQPARGYRAGVDPVLLAASCSVAPGARVLDCGAGIGTVGLCVARRLPEVFVTLVERAVVYAALARVNITENHLADRVSVIEADVTAPLSRTEELAALAGTYDHVLANPPYYVDTDGTRGPDALKDAANTMPHEALESWLRFCAAMLKPGGRVTLVHRVDALPRIFAAMERRFGAITVWPIQPRAEAACQRLLVRAIKDSRAPLSLLSPLVLHEAAGGYRPDVVAVLRDGAALTFPSTVIA